MEEVGLEIELIGPKGWVKTDTVTNQDLVPPLFVNRHRINDVHEHSSFIFVGISKTREINQLSEAEVTQCKWVSKDELVEIHKSGELRDDVYRYCLKALELVNEKMS